MVRPAADAGVVIGGVQKLRNGRDLAGERRGEAVHPNVDHVATGENRSPRRHALRGGGVGPVKAHAAPGQAVQVRGLQVGIAVGAQIRHAVVVGQDEEDVGSIESIRGMVRI